MKKNLLQFLLIGILVLSGLTTLKAQDIGESNLQAHKPKIELHGVSVSEIYPNPAEQMAYFDYRMPQKNKSVRIEIFNLIGKVVWKEELNRTSGTAAVNLNNFKRGIYFYRLQVDSDKTSIKKLVVR